MNIQIFLQIGDVNCKVLLASDVLLLSRKTEEIRFPILFSKNEKACFYLSDTCQLKFIGRKQNYSKVGEIVYFPQLQSLGIGYEENTCDSCLSRFVLGCLKGNICQLSSLREQEEGIFFIKVMLQQS